MLFPQGDGVVHVQATTDSGQRDRHFTNKTWGRCLASDFSPDGRFAVFATSADGLLHVCDLTTKKEKGPGFPGPREEITCLAVAPRETHVLIADAKSVTLWSLQTFKLTRSLVGHTDRIRCLAFSPDGQRTVTGGADAIVRLWDVVTGKELKHSSEHKAPVGGVAFSPDGQWVVSCGDGIKQVGPAQALAGGPSSPARLAGLEPGSNRGNARVAARCQRAEGFRHVGNVPPRRLSPPFDRLIDHANFPAAHTVQVVGLKSLCPLALSLGRIHYFPGSLRPPRGARQPCTSKRSAPSASPPTSSPTRCAAQTYRCEECEEEFVISKKAKRTDKKPPRPRRSRPPRRLRRSRAVEAAEVLPEAKLIDKPPKPKQSRAEDEEVLEIPDDAVQGAAPVVKTAPTARRRRDEDEDEDRPKKRRRQADQDDDDRPRQALPRRSGVPVGLVVGLSAGAVFLFGLLGLGVWWAFPEIPQEKPQAQANNPPANNAKPKAVEKPPPPKEEPPPKKEPPKKRAAAQGRAAAEGVDCQDRSAGRRGQDARRLQEGDPCPRHPAGRRLPRGAEPVRGDRVEPPRGDERQVWNLQTGEMTGKVAGLVSSTSHPVLSADGRTWRSCRRGGRARSSFGHRRQGRGSPSHSGRP